jgi:hypothetical protein
MSISGPPVRESNSVRAVTQSTISRLVNRFRDTAPFHRVASNMRKRVNACMAERGGHFQQLI